VAVAGGNYEQARRRFEEAVDSYRQAGSPDGVARARLDLAGALSGLGRDKAAESEASAALDTFRQLGAQREAARASALLDNLRQQRSRTLSQQGSASLTPREREILRLVARGLSDKEIAADLGLSPHTVHRHISNILTRLNVASRAAAVASAARDGLLA
jgi:RNA polymerase sigma factor (sigma-70 family)